MLDIGSRAPEFTLQNQDGKEVSLSEYKGKKVVLYFYPKDDTAGCTKQACNFSAIYPDFMENGAQVIGVSKDSVVSHRKFVDKYNLPFTLLADTELQVIQEYDVWKEKSMYGKKYMGVERTTYLIDEEGIIVKAFSKVNAAKNPADMLKTIVDSAKGKA
jgi:peroxiredoxin Q/BCP